MFADKLKKSLLQAAIQGQLTEQLPTDGDARDLLKKFRAEKAKLLAAKKIKAEKPLPPISDDEIPFELPANWCWCRLGEIGNYKKGPFGSSLTKDIFVPKSNDAVKVYEQKNAIQKDASLGVYYISKKYFYEKMSGFEVKPGDIIVSCAGTIGESYIMPSNMEKGIINQALMRMKIFVPMNVEYFLLFFDFVLKQNAKLNSKGSAIKNIPPFEVLKNFLVPLPPLAEQKRIVERLDELLREVEELEKAERELNMHVKNFPRKMKNSLLQAAIQGQLTEQLPTDGDARDLLKKIRAEKVKLLATKKIKAEKPLPPITNDEIPFDLPANWCWCRLGEIGMFVSGYTPKNDDLTTSGKIPYFKVADMNTAGNEIWLRHTKLYLKNDIARSYEKYTIVYPKNGGAVFTNKKRILQQNSVVDLNTGGYKVIEPLNLMYVFNYFMTIDFKFFSKGTALPTLDNKRLRELLIPLPPLAEQERIVERLNELLPLCEI